MKNNALNVLATRQIFRSALENILILCYEEKYQIISICNPQLFFCWHQSFSGVQSFKHYIKNADILFCQKTPYTLLTAVTCEQVSLIWIPMKYLTNDVCHPTCYLCCRKVNSLYACFQCDVRVLHSLLWLSLDLHLCRPGEGIVSTSHPFNRPPRESCVGFFF